MNISLSGFPAYIAILLTLSLISLLPMYILSKLRRKSYELNRKYDTIIKAEYSPPCKLTPAEVGYLTDAKFSKREFFATILDLEQRGYITLEKKSGYAFAITVLDQKTGILHKHEQLIIEDFSNTKSLSINNIKNLKKFRQAVLLSLISKGLVKKNYLNVSSLAGRIVSIFFIINSLLTLLFIFIGDSDFGERLTFLFLTPILISPLTLPLSFILGFVYNKTVGETGLWTKKMKSAYSEVAGYQHFIEQVELDNIQFESSELKIMTKNKAFPYAVALGLNTAWEDRFK